MCGFEAALVRREGLSRERAAMCKGCLNDESTGPASETCSALRDTQWVWRGSCHCQEALEEVMAMLPSPPSFGHTYSVFAAIVRAGLLLAHVIDGK